HHLALEPVEGPQLRPLQEPARGRAARIGTPHRRGGRAQEVLRRVLEGPHGGCPVRLSLFPAAGVRDATGLRGLRGAADLRGDLPVAQGSALDRKVAPSARANAARSSTCGEWPLDSNTASVECGTRRWISSAWSTGQIQSWR